MQVYSIITTLPYSHFSSSIIAQRKPKKKLLILVDLRRINLLLKSEYIQHETYHPVTTITDTAEHMAGKKYFCKLDGSHVHHCFQMADEQSVQLVAFNFESRTFAYFGWRRDSTDPSRHSIPQFVKKSMHLLRPTNVLNTSTTSVLLQTTSKSYCQTSKPSSNKCGM